MEKIEIFNQLDEEIKELETVEKVLLSAIKKECLEDVTFNLIILDNSYKWNSKNSLLRLGFFH